MSLVPVSDTDEGLKTQNPNPCIVRMYARSDLAVVPAVGGSKGALEEQNIPKI